MNEEFNINFEQTEEETEIREENNSEQNSSGSKPNFNYFFGMSSYEEYIERDKFKKSKATSFSLTIPSKTFVKYIFS